MCKVVATQRLQLEIMLHETCYETSKVEWGGSAGCSETGSQLSCGEGPNQDCWTGYTEASLWPRQNQKHKINSLSMGSLFSQLSEQAGKLLNVRERQRLVVWRKRQGLWSHGREICFSSLFPKSYFTSDVLAAMKGAHSCNCFATSESLVSRDSNGLHFVFE